MGSIAQKFFGSTQDKIAVASIGFVFVFLLILMSQLQQLPGPLYGGDLYGHLGYTRNYVLNGFWSDPYFINEFPFYPWFGNFLIAALSFLTGMDIMKAMIFMPVITTTVSMFAYYLLGTQFFKSKNAGLILMGMSLVVNGIRDGAPNLTAWMIAAPFLFYFWLRFEEKHSWKDAVATGIFLGITSLTQVEFFLAILALFVVFIIMMRFLPRSPPASHATQVSHTSEHPAAIWTWKDLIVKYAVIAAIGIAISLLFYGPILIKYHAKSVNPLFMYNDTRIELLGIGWKVQDVFNQFITLSSVTQFLYGIIALLGLVLCVGNFRKKKECQLLLGGFVISVLLPLHHLITRPLFNFWVLPGHIGTGLYFIKLFLFVYGIFGIGTFLKAVIRADHVRRAVMLSIAGLLCLAMFVEDVNGYNSDRWVQYGRQIDPMSKAWFDAGSWIRQNTDKNAVFITNDETCFAMNGVSGRKCVMVRRTHANYFVDVEKRYADGVVMLYGNDSKVIDSLIANYSTSYLLLDPYMFQTYIKVFPKYKQYLLENGVQFQEGMDRLDPAAAEAEQFDLLLVPAQNISAVLLNRTSIATTITENGQAYLQILSVNKR